MPQLFSAVLLGVVCQLYVHHTVEFGKETGFFNVVNAVEQGALTFLTARNYVVHLAPIPKLHRVHPSDLCGVFFYLIQVEIVVKRIWRANLY